MHSEIRARLSEYLERDLDPEGRSLIDAHLSKLDQVGFGELAERLGLSGKCLDVG